ncbi:Fucose permease [Deinococcus hopiensis KR-140]|uniref:Fucose permease n=1 Tax=Deinococcus hopiensis KR-140 TaxID=695939 RepID=A0A1W1VU76_9DEIO|nr:Fucose permease [Deinococcus hopiensis KR-140]
MWGASLPRIREQTGIDDAQLGLALLFIGAGALPAMLFTGRALDRWGLRFAVVAIIALGLAGLGVALSAHGFVALCLGLTVVGATSGATDVAMNSVGGRAEKLSGQPILTRSGGVFSSFVVVSSIFTGVLSSMTPVSTSFFVVAVLAIVAGVRTAQALAVELPHSAVEAKDLQGSAHRELKYTPLLLIGVLGAITFATENAHQSWGAIFLEEELHSGSGFSALAPAVFAGVVALTRFSIGALRPHHFRTVLTVGLMAATVGTVIVASATSVHIVIAGLTVAAAGTAPLYPTLLSVVSRNVDEVYRGRATALVTVVSYVGFLLGPVYFGFWAHAMGLRNAMLATAALSGILIIATPPLLRLSGFAHQRRTSGSALLEGPQ